MTPIRLFSGPLSMFGMKAEIAALEKALPVDLVIVPYNAETGYDPKPAEVVRINPKGQVPVLIHDDLEIFDSTQIFEYLETIAPEPALWPGDPKQKAQARLIEHKADEIYFPFVVQLMYLQDNLTGDDALAVLDAARAFYEEMETHLKGNAYLGGDYSYADIGFYMCHVFGERMGATMTAATPKLLEWRAAMTMRPAVGSVMRNLVAYLEANERSVPEFLSRLCS